MLCYVHHKYSYHLSQFLAITVSLTVFLMLLFILLTYSLHKWKPLSPSASPLETISLFFVFIGLILLFVYSFVVVLCSHKKGRGHAICDNTDGPEGINAEWNKSDWDRQLPYDFTINGIHTPFLKSTYQLLLNILVEILFGMIYIESIDLERMGVFIIFSF